MKDFFKGDHLKEILEEFKNEKITKEEAIEKIKKKMEESMKKKRILFISDGGDIEIFMDENKITFQALLKKVSNELALIFGFAPNDFEKQIQLRCGDIILLDNESLIHSLRNNDFKITVAKKKKRTIDEILIDVPLKSIKKKINNKIKKEKK